MIPDLAVLMKKGVARAWILLVLGLIGLIIALIVYPTWQVNGDRLATREQFGWDTPQDHQTYNAQSILVLGGLLVGTPMLLGGVYLVVTISSYNKKLDEMLIQKAMQSYPSYEGAPGTKSFCPFCGNQVPPGAEMCIRCGGKLT